MILPLLAARALLFATSASFAAELAPTTPTERARESAVVVVGDVIVVAERPEGTEGGEVSIDLDALRAEVRSVTEGPR